MQVGRWPFRKLKSMDKLIKSVQEQASHDPAGAAAVLAQLHAFKEEIYQNPEVGGAAAGCMCHGQALQLHPILSIS